MQGLDNLLDAFKTNYSPLVSSIDIKGVKFGKKNVYPHIQNLKVCCANLDELNGIKIKKIGEAKFDTIHPVRLWIPNTYVNGDGDVCALNPNKHLEPYRDLNANDDAFYYPINGLNKSWDDSKDSKLNKKWRKKIEKELRDLVRRKDEKYSAHQGIIYHPHIDSSKDCLSCLSACMEEGAPIFSLERGGSLLGDNLIRTKGKGVHFKIQKGTY